jgi:hypothetical protein
MSRSIFLFAAILLLLSCNEHTVYRADPLAIVVNEETAKEDFDLFGRILKKAHPSLADNNTDIRTNTILDSVFKTIPSNGVILRDLYNKIAFVADEIGCSHTFTSLPQDAYDSMYYRKLFFPYPVTLIEGNLVINSTSMDLEPGTRIESINKVPVDEILASMLMYNTVDGTHRETQRYMAASNFSLEYFTRFGTHAEFELKVTDTTGKRKTVFADPVSLDELNDEQQNLYYFDATDVTYSLRVKEEENYALFRLTRFDFDSHNQEQSFEAFLENSFDLLSLRKDIRNLIIDLRENRGGDLYYCFLLYSYLCDKPFSEYKSVFTRIRTIPFKEALSTFETMDFGGINDRLRNEFIVTDKHGYLTPDSMIKKWEPHEKRFKGNVYIITNANTASAASYFTSLVRNSGRGRVVGIETCGSEHSINGLSSLRYRLPATGIGIEFPYAKLVYSLRANTADRGIIPDHVIPDTYESFKNNEDKQVKFIIDSLISKKR